MSDTSALAGRSVAELLQHGMAQHRAGRLDLAEAAYRQILATAPQHAETWHLLGVIALQRGHHDRAITAIDEAIRLAGDRAAYYCNRALALRGLGRHAEAEASCRTALRLDPDFADAQSLLGVMLRAAGRLAEAEPCFREAVRLRPGFVEGHNNLANLLSVLGRPTEAEASYRMALALQPDHPEILTNLAGALGALRRHGEAETAYRQALRLDPNRAAAHFGLGNTLFLLNRPGEAETAYREALRLDPACLEAHVHLGRVLLRLDRPAEAEQSFRAALRQRPDHPETLADLGFALLDQGLVSEAEAAYRSATDLEPALAEAQFGLGNIHLLDGWSAEAEACYRAALRLDPDHSKAHYNLGLLLLATGRFAEGWEHHEWRGAVYGFGRRNFAAPLWTGEALGDRVLLVHAEQGLGDTLQFCRYLPLIAQRARLVVEVQPSLRDLISAMPGIGQVVARGDTLPHFDLHCPLLSLPHRLGTVLETVPGAAPYLAADPARSVAWRQRLAPLDGLRVGLVWAGGVRSGRTALAAVDERRSIALDRLAPLADIAGVSFVSLQKGPPAAQAAHPPPGMRLHDFTDALDDFAETAALIEALDLVIGVDTAVPHLAGALGKPVWLLNRFDTCWRWLLDRDDSPWYPTLRQFRQPAPGDWASVIAAVKTALIERVGIPVPER